MKHSLKMTLILILFFILSQLVGLTILNLYINPNKVTIEGNKTIVGFKELPMNIERPQVQNKDYSFLLLLFGVLAGTVLLLFLVKWKKANLWKFWYASAVFFALSIAFYPLIQRIFPKALWPTIILAIVLTIWKIIRPNIIVHNLTEIFIYAGIAAIFVPILNILSAFLLLIFIAIYDAFAVWKSKHMIKLAEFQLNSRIFAGINFGDFNSSRKHIIHKKDTHLKSKKNKNEKKAIILGGGDIAFPLMFIGTVFKEFYFTNMAWYYALIILVMTTLSLAFLLIISKKEKFYPAMPFIAFGCFIGYLMSIIIC